MAVRVNVGFGRLCALSPAVHVTVCGTAPTVRVNTTDCSMVVALVAGAPVACRVGAIAGGVNVVADVATALGIGPASDSTALPLLTLALPGTVPVPPTMLAAVQVAPVGA